MTTVKKEYNKRAWLVSGVFRRNSGRGTCRVRFYYYMYGKDINQLNVYTRTSNNLDFLKQWKKLWSHSKEVGNFWIRGSVDIKESSMFEIIFEGMAGLDRYDAIALDDITFTPGCEYLKDKTLPSDGTTLPGSTTTPGPTPCKPNEFFCTEDKVCIPGIRRCDFREDCKDKTDEEGCVKPSCDFQDRNMCGWEVKNKYNNAPRPKRSEDDTSIYQWIPIQANDEHTKINLQYRPKTDHTTNSTEGWYLLADGAPGKFRDVTSLISPYISASNAQCSLDFWIYLSQTSAILSVHAGKPENMVRIWDSLANIFEIHDRNSWVHAKARLSSLSDFQVRFDARRPWNHKSAVSLDDISFESCPPPISVDPESKTCSGGEFMCGNGKCISKNLRCDYANDCGDNSDENHCGTFLARCDFSHDICEWNVEPDGKASWVRKTAVIKGRKADVPSADHTTFSNNGQYITAISSSKNKNRQPKIRSPTIDYSSSDCAVRFWYNVFHEYNKILIYKRTSYDSDGMKFLGDLSSDVPDYWNRAEVVIPTDSVSKDDFQVVLAASFADSFGSVSIDDISLSDKCIEAKGRDIPGNPITPPPIDDCAPDKFQCKNGKGCFTHLERCNFINNCEDKSDEYDCGTNCTFEDGTCGWYTPVYSSFNWTVQEGKESSAIYDLPKVDHTLGTAQGHFLIPKGLTRPKDSAQIITKPYTISGGSCKMEFWYFMYGGLTYVTPVTLKVFLLQSKKNDNHVTLATLEGRTKEIKWYQKTVEINTRNYFSIGFEGISGASYFSVIAVDDILFKECAPDHPPVECAHDEWTCVEQKQCIKKYQYCDGNYDCEDKSDEFQCQPQFGDCNFDSEKWMEECSWESKNLDFEWSRALEGRSKETGPVRGQNPRQEGYFLYINSNDQDTDRQAGVMTPVFKAGKGNCYLRFWYTMNGSPGLGTLEVHSEGEQGQNFLVWMEKGPQGKDWLVAHVEIGNSQDYRISFIATRGEDNKTDIAIDEVRFTPECRDGGDEIDPTGPTSICAWNEFTCKSGGVKCIPREWVCNCAKDCTDGSDEEDCTTTCLSTVEPQTLPTSTAWPTETVIPRKHCKPGENLCSDGTTCIPGLLLCDGIEDCPDGSDEKDGCKKAKLCGEKFYFCKDKADPPCISREKVCNGVKDCSDGSDESLCDKCPDNFCKNGGTCSVLEHKPICQCKKDFLQNRCGRKSVAAELDELQKSKQSGVGWIIGVVVGTILLIAIMFIIWYKRNTNAERSRLAHAVENPVYGLNLDTLTFGELNSHMPVRHEDGAGATAIENPLYAFKSEIK